MAFPLTYGSSLQAISDYVRRLDHLPANYTDPSSGMQVLFSWHKSGGWGGLPPDQLIPGYTTKGGGAAGFSGIIRAVVDALKRDYALTSAPVVLKPPDPTPVTSPTLWSGDPIPVTVPQTTGSPLPTRTVSAIAAPEVRRTAIPAPTATPVTRTSTMDSTLIGTTIGTIIGGPGGGTIGGLIGSVIPGESRCPGPYNYDPVTGGCVPKPDYLTRTGGGELPGSPGVNITGYGTSGLTSTQCPTGYRWDGSRCVVEGIGGYVERMLPGGSTGVLPQGSGGYGEAVVGAFGVPALVPAQVGQINGGPILRCPTGAVLGKDNLCYMKGSIPSKYRKWRPGPRPLLTGGEMKMLRKINTLENKVKRAWSMAGKPGQRKCSTRRK